ncbi:hypothetical protein, partial [Sphingomonas zeae]
PQDGQAHPDDSAAATCLSQSAAFSADQPPIISAPDADFFNTIAQTLPFRPPSQRKPKTQLIDMNE